MDALTIEAWHKPAPDQKSIAVGEIHFRVDQDTHLKLEEAEQRLQDSGGKEEMVDANMATLDLQTSDKIGDLKECKFRVYLDAEHDRGHFHLVGNRVEDGSLVYTNAVMVDQFE